MSINPTAGSAVLVKVGPLDHYGVVSDQWHDGMPMVISHSRRRGTTAEEPWGVFTQGGQVYSAGLTSRFPAHEVVRRARSWAGRAYSVLFSNCEHHVRYALGRTVESPQLRAALATIVAVVLAFGVASMSARRTA